MSITTSDHSTTNPVVVAEPTPPAPCPHDVLVGIELLDDKTPPGAYAMCDGPLVHAAGPANCGFLVHHCDEIHDWYVMGAQMADYVARHAAHALVRTAAS